MSASHRFAVIALLVLIAACRRAETVVSDTTASGTAASETAVSVSPTRAIEPVRVLVVADGFLKDHESWFVKEVLSKVREGFAMLPGASDKMIRIEYVYLKSDSDTELGPQLGLKYDDLDQANCYFTNREAVLPEIYKQKQQVKGFSPIDIW